MSFVHAETFAPAFESNAVIRPSEVAIKTNDETIAGVDPLPVSEKA
jgi:hypothetical protein